MGHQQLLAATCQAADTLGVVPSVLCFRPFPEQIFTGQILANSQSFCVLSCFKTIRYQTVNDLPLFCRCFTVAETFIQTILVDACQAKTIVVGEYSFCAGRQGDVSLLRRELSIPVIACPLHQIAGQRISSHANVRRYLTINGLFQQHAVVLLASLAGRQLTGRYPRSK